MPAFEPIVEAILSSKRTNRFFMCQKTSWNCSSSADDFLISWKTTGRQIVVYYSESTILFFFLVVRLRHFQFFRKNSDHLLGSASCANNFCGIWRIFKHPYSRQLSTCTFRLIRINVRLITCRDIIDVLRSTALVFLEHFCLTNRH